MAVIVNRESIKNKMIAYINSPQYRKSMKDEIMRRRKDGRGGKDIGLEIHTEAEMEAALQALIGMLRSNAGALPASVAAHFGSLTASGISYSEDETSATATVSFGGDLSRPSLVSTSGSGSGSSTGGGINDIVMLFNTGYEASRRVYGYYSNWGASKRDPSEGPSGDMVIASRQSRPGLGFLEAAVDAFNAAYGGFAHASL